MLQQNLFRDRISTCTGIALGMRPAGYHGGCQRFCQECKQPFFVYGRTRPTAKNKLLFCSRACKDKSQNGQEPGFKQTTKPEGSRRDRINANGLINMRIRRGADTKPKNCVKCGRGDCKIDGHHPDYSQPSLVAWLCRSCHMKAHRSVEFEKEVAELARQVNRTVGAA